MSPRTTRRSSLERAFLAVRRRAAEIDPRMLSVVVRGCPVTEREHGRSQRQFMHVNHRPGVVCVARSAEALDLPWQVGLFAHEFGHLLFGGARHSEEDANEMGSAVLGSPVTFRGPLRLEWGEPPEELR